MNGGKGISNVGKGGHKLQRVSKTIYPMPR